jgi:hypothetical protein
MQCLKPRNIMNKKTGSWVTVPCGSCNFCLSNKRSDWSFRLLQELGSARTARFITLTYDDKSVPLELDEKGEPYFALDKAHLGNFHKVLKQWQKRYLKREAKKLRLNTEDKTKYFKRWAIRYYSVGEYGSNTDRPHYHSILFNLHPTTVETLASGGIWGKGFVHFGEVTGNSINYVCKYVIDRNTDLPKGRVKPFTFMSKNPGIGHSYLAMKSVWHKADGDPQEDLRFYIQDGKFKKRLPRYYKDRIFSEEERILAGATAQAQAMEAYDKLIAELEYKHYGNPHTEYNKRREFAHAMIRVKSKNQNTF